MPFLLLILPILAHILLAAHLLFHGLGLFVSVLPLLAVPLLFIPKRWMVWLQSALLVLWGIEWLRSAWGTCSSAHGMGRALDAGRRHCCRLRTLFMADYSCFPPVTHPKFL